LVKGAQLLARAIRVLELFTPDAPTWSTSEISGVIGLPKSNVYRIVRMLQQHEYLSQDPESKRFRLGSGAMALGWRALESSDIRHIARPVMRRLAEETGETVLLTVLSEDRSRSVCIDRIDSPHSVRLILEVGRRIPLHAGASSKVLLAYLPEDEIERVVAASGLPRVCRNTITNGARLLRHLEEIRRAGYALSCEETDEGAAGVASAVLRPDTQVVAALGIAGPLGRFTRGALPRQIECVRRAAATMAGYLGNRQTEPRRLRSTSGIRSYAGV